MAKKKKAQKGLSRDQRFQGIYGDAGSYMEGLDRKQRIGIKKLAAKRGLTLTGLLQTGTPEPLRERSSASLRAQALKTVNSAYAPADASLTSRQTAISALDAKRRIDNQYYSDWLTGQQRSADAVSATSDAALLAQAGQLHGAAQAAGDGQQQQAIGQAAATPGTVSDPAQSTALQGLSANTTKSVGAADIANAAAISQVARSGAQRATLQASNYAQAAALEARRQGDTFSSLAKLSDDTTAEKLNKAADTNKEVSRLLDNEVTKAQNNEQTSILSNKLNVQQSQFAQSLKIKKGALAVSKKNAATALTKAQHTAMLGDEKFKLDQAKYGDAQAKDIYQRQHALGPYKPSAPKAGANRYTAGERTASRKQITSINNAVSTIRTLTQNAGAKANTHEIRQILTGQKNVKNPNGGYDHDIVNAAYDIVALGHLSPQNYKTLKAEGLLIPKQWRPPGTSRRK